MQRLLLIVDSVSAFFGKIFSWAIVILTLITCYDVTMRYVFASPTNWAYDVSYMLYGTLFMMTGAYTLSRNGHVRGDVLYGFFKPRWQAGLDLVLYFAFFLPGILALSYAGVAFAEASGEIKEASSVVADGPPIYPYKTLIPIAGCLVLLQGLAEITRCVICLKSGDWPQRLHDVEEVNVEAMKKDLHITDDLAQGAAK
jgi:TRAP-type mannitol/chloroaromatic compound transport system permease small subunit